MTTTLECCCIRLHHGSPNNGCCQLSASSTADADPIKDIRTRLETVIDIVHDRAADIRKFITVDLQQLEYCDFRHTSHYERKSLHRVWPEQAQELYLHV